MALRVPDLPWHPVSSFEALSIFSPMRNVTPPNVTQLVNSRAGFEAGLSVHPMHVPTSRPLQPRAPAHGVDLDFSFSGLLSLSHPAALFRRVWEGPSLPPDRCSSPHRGRKPPGWPCRPCPGRQTGRTGVGVISEACFVCPALVIPCLGTAPGQESEPLLLPSPTTEPPANTGPSPLPSVCHPSQQVLSLSPLSPAMKKLRIREVE